MDIFLIVWVSILIVAIAAVAGVKICNYYKSTGKEFNFTDFVDTYGDKIIKVLKDVVLLIKIDENQFSSREEYEKVIIQETIIIIKDNYNDFGIDKTILDLIDPDKLASVIADILHKNSIDIFSVVDSFVIAEHYNLYPEEVVAAAAASIKR